MKGIEPTALIRVDDVLRYLDADRFMDKKKSAEYLGVSVRTFEGWMNQIPKYRPGGKLLFKKSELDAFMKRHQELPTHVDVDINKLADELLRKVLG